MDLYKLLEKRNKKNDYKDELFPKILLKCHRRIELSNSAGNLNTIYSVPKYVIGYPLFNKNEIIEYLLKNLTKNGFDVYSYSEIDNDYLYISWQSAYEKYKEDKQIEKNLIDFESTKTLIYEEPLEKINKIDKTIFSKPIKKFSLLD
jgi:hypothetical protein